MTPFDLADRRISILSVPGQTLLDIDYASYIELFDSAAMSTGMQIEVLPGGLRLYRCGAARPCAFVVSGQHGGERAGPIALLEMVQSGDLPDSCSLYICPIVSPTAWDFHERAPHGINANRTWSPEVSSAGVSALMRRMQEVRPDIFLDLHESDEREPDHGKVHEIRHSGTPWGEALIDALGPDRVGAKVDVRIPGSARMFAERIGVPATATVESSALTPPDERLEFHKSVIRTVLGI